MCWFNTFTNCKMTTTIVLAITSIPLYSYHVFFVCEKKNDLSYMMGSWLLNYKTRPGNCVATRTWEESLSNPCWAGFLCGHLQGDLVLILFLLIMYGTGSRLATEYGTKAWPFCTVEPVLRVANNHQAGIPAEKCASSHMPGAPASLEGYFLWL